MRIPPYFRNAKILHTRYCIARCIKCNAIYSAIRSRSFSIKLVFATERDRLNYFYFRVNDISACNIIIRFGKQCVTYRRRYPGILQLNRERKRAPTRRNRRTVERSIKNNGAENYLQLFRSGQNNSVTHRVGFYGRNCIAAVAAAATATTQLHVAFIIASGNSSVQ